jgi:hypothetical protein
MLKSKVFRILTAWVYAIVAPLLIASLYWVSQDFITSMFWLLAFGYVVTICLYLLVKLYKHFIKREKVNLALPHVLRPVLCLVAYLFANEMVYLSVVSANEKALKLAIDMKHYVLKNGQCGKAGKEWQSSSRYSENRKTIKYGIYGTKYYISYNCEPLKRDFSYIVRMNKDADFKVEYLESGKLKLTYGHFAHTKSTFFDENSDMNKLARMEI